MGRPLKRPSSSWTAAWLLLCVSISAVPWAETQERQFQPEYFEKPERAAWQKPDEVVGKLNLKAGDAVADIGAGSGYFSRRLARAVGDRGVVYAVDIDQSMLRYIHEVAEREGLRNIVTVLCPPNDPMLTPGSVDLIFICDTIHHISNRSDYYDRLRRCLKPGGRIAIVDFQKKPLPVNAPPLNMRISKEDLTKELATAGFGLSEDLHLLPYQYFLVFIPASGPEK